MINITYSPSFKAIVVFDEVFTYSHFCKNEVAPIDVVVEGVKTIMDDYNFKQADIIDAETGEIEKYTTEVSTASNPTKKKNKKNLKKA